MTAGAGAGSSASRRRRGLAPLRATAGLGLIELALVLVVAALAGVALYGYFASSARTLETVREERPLSQARLAADRATLTAIRSALALYYGQHGRWPESREQVGALLSPPPSFQCGGNDYQYDAASGAVNLLIDDQSRC